MPSVDNRVVSMTFDNDRFMSRLGDTIDALDKLSKSIDDAGNNDAFDRLNSAAQGFDVSNIADAVDNISGKFSALGAIGFSAIQHVTEGVFNMVNQLVDIGKQDVLAPILTGGKERAMNIEQAKFMFQGMGIDVNAAMKSSKDAVLGTAYGLDAAAKVAAQLGASGIKTGDQMTGALRGIAGAAAMTGSSFSEIGDIFAQSAASGKVRTIDLEQFSTRGLNAAAAVAKVMGKTEQQVRDMASNGTLDFATFAGAMDKAFGKHATEANKTYAGSLDNLHAAMSRMGEAFLAQRLDQERDVFNALSPAIDKMTKSMKPLADEFVDIGDKVSKHLIKVINGIDFKQFDIAFKNIAAAIKTFYATFESITGLIRVAFRNMFPESATSVIVKMSQELVKIADIISNHLKPGMEAFRVIGDVFQALFGIFKVAFDVVKGVVSVIEHLVGIIRALTNSSKDADGGLLGLIDKFALLIIKVENFLTGGGGLERFFSHVNALIDIAVVKIQQFIDKVQDLADKVEQKLQKPTKAVEDFGKKINDFLFGTKALGKNNLDHGLDGTADSTNRVQQRIDQLANTWDRFTAEFNKIVDRIKGPLDKAWQAFARWMDDFKQKIVNAFKPGDFDSSVDAVNVGLLTALTLMFRRFMKGGIGISFDSSLFTKIKESFDQLTNTLKAMQTEVKAEAIEKIAISVGIMAASLLVLSLIDSKKLTVALLAITAVMAGLIGMLQKLDDIGGGDKSAGSIKLTALSATMIAMSTSLLIMAGALAILAALDPARLAAAIGAMGASMGILIGALKIIEDGGKDMLSASFALQLIAGSMVVLSGALAILAAIDPTKLAGAMLALTLSLTELVTVLQIIKDGGEQTIAAAGALNLIASAMVVLAGALSILASLDPTRLAIALIAIGLGLTELVTALQVIKNGGAQTIEAAFALNLIATAMVILSKALELIGGMDWKQLDQGLLGMAAALAIIIGALLIINPEDIILIGAGLILMSIAINGIAIALQRMGEMKGGDLAKGIAAMAASLLILAAGSIAMEEGLPGAIALGVMAASMLLLTEVLVKLASIKPLDLVKALLVMVAVISGLAGLSLLLSSAIVPMIGLAVGIGILGAAFVLLGGGLFLLGKGLQAIAEGGIAGAEALGKALGILFKSVLAEFKNEIKDLLDAVPLLIRLIDAILSQLLESLTKLIPQIGKLMIAIVKTGLKELREVVPDVIATGLMLLMKLLDGIQNNIGPIVDAVLTIIANFLQAIADNIDKIIQAGVNIITQFLLGIASAQDQIVSTFFQILVMFVETIANNVQMLVDAGTQILINFLLGITNDVSRIIDTVTFIIQFIMVQIGAHAVDIAATGTNVLIWFLGALTGDVIRIANSITAMIIALVGALGNDAGRIAQAGADALSRFLGGLGGDAKIIGKAVSKLIGDIVDAMVNVLNNIPDQLKRLADAFIGMLEGLATVIRQEAKPLGKALGDLADALVDGFSDAFIAALKRMAQHIGGPLGDAVVGVFNTVFDRHSPSKVMMALGKDVIDGFTIGLTESLKITADAAAHGSSNVTDAMSTALSNASDILGNTAEFNPTITPVLDLTRVQTEAGKINDMMLAKISPDASFVQANDISAQQAALNAARAAAANPLNQTPSTVEFNQTINAPQPLSANDIYRNTKSQIVLAKKELGIGETN